ncbi:DNA polymerase IV [Thermoleophilia bacterium SCSIO 60948]|nr:DNA polymerase IV [Thermoleophilia bacterium SCSIO 60948]
MFVRQERTDASILHADADAFFAAVEQRDDRSLRGRPVAVGSGVVMAASYEARAYGIRGGMGGAEAKRRCPEIRFAPPRFTAYIEASRGLFDVFRGLSPVVEGLSLEEAFLDGAGLDHIGGTPLEIADRLRRECMERVGLAVTVGLGRTKLVAKMASRAAKPDGLLLIEPGRERDFLDALPVESIWGIGPKTAEQLHRNGLRRVGDVTRLPEGSLVAIVGGPTGSHLHALLTNRRGTRVRPSSGRRSVGAQHAIGRARRSRSEQRAIVASLVERVSRRMRTGGRSGRTISLRLRFGDYTRATRSLTLAAPTAAGGLIELAALRLLDEAGPEISARGLTLLGVAVTNLSAPGLGVQLGLELDSAASQGLDLALDEIRGRYGATSVTRGPGTDRWLSEA